MRVQKKGGFSLIELLTVMSILGILSVIAMPVFNNYRLRAGRLEGQVALLQGAQFMELYFNENDTYSGATVDTTVPLMSEGGRFNLSFTVPPAAASFTLTATAQVAQAKDSLCAVMSITQTGAKTPEACW